MVLSDIEINAERLLFDPPIADEDERVDSSSVDLLLHPDLVLLPAERVQGVTIVPSDRDVEVMNLLSLARRAQVAYFEPLPPGASPPDYRQDP